MKLLILGFDAADYRTITEKGYFKELREANSSWGKLRSIMSENDHLPHTGPCWSTMYTGVRPGVHGVSEGGWLFEHKNWKDFKVPTVFSKIKEKYSLGLIGLPLTYPADAHGECADWIVSGYPVPDPSVATKPWFFGVSEELMKDYQADVLNRVDVWKDFDENKRREYIWKTGKKIDEAKFELVKKLPKVDVLFFGFMQLDRIGHFGGEKEFYDCYDWAEDFAKEVIEYFSPENVLIVSDHGYDIGYNEHDINGFWLRWPVRVCEKDVKRQLLDVRPMIEEILELD